MSTDRPGDVSTPGARSWMRSTPVCTRHLLQTRALMLARRRCARSIWRGVQGDKGLSSAYPERVLTTPISEAGIVGIASGMALRGMRPGGRDHVRRFPDPGSRPDHQPRRQIPLDVQRPGARAAGSSHPDGRAARLRSDAQPDPGKAFPGCARAARGRAGIALGDPGELLRATILEGEDPLLFIENKLLYSLPLFQENDSEDLSLRNRMGERPQAKRGDNTLP